MKAAILLALTVTLGLSACGGEKAAPTPIATADQVTANLPGVETAAQRQLADLYLAARAAGEPGATIYVASVPEELKPVADAFAEAFPGLKADYQRFIGDKLTARLDGEYGSGQHTGDVVLSSFNEAARLAAIGRLQAYEPPTLGDLPQTLRSPQKTYYAPYKKAFTLLYNTRLVGKDEIPRTIQDVLQPKWRDRYIAPGSGAAGPIDTALAILLARGDLSDAQVADFERYGDVGPPSSELIPNVAQGRYAFALWSNAAAGIAQRDRGAPIEIGFSPDLSIQTNVAAGILSKAPHLNSAKLFEAWLFTPKAQAILADIYFYPAQPGAPTPKGFPPIAGNLNGALAEDGAYFDRIRAFRDRRVAVARQNR